MKIPILDLTRQYELIREEVEAAVLEQMCTGNYIGGNAVVDFEKKFADFIGVKHAISVNSFVMNSGYLNIELYKDSEKQITAIYVNYGVEINGGIIVVKYNGNAVDAYPVIVARKNIDDESL